MISGLRASSQSSIKTRKARYPPIDGMLIITGNQAAFQFPANSCPVIQ
jgi:hypothetical protein